MCTTTSRLFWLFDKISTGKSGLARKSPYIAGRLCSKKSSCFRLQSAGIRSVNLTHQAWLLSFLTAWHLSQVLKMQPAHKECEAGASLKLFPPWHLPVAPTKGCGILRLGNKLHPVTYRGLAGLALSIFLQHSVIVTEKSGRLEQVPGS